MNEPVVRRGIRSFSLREGRMTKGQQTALSEHWAEYGLALVPQNLENIFTQTGPLVLEIGFGMGDSLVLQAADEPNTRFIGVEVHRPGVGHLINKAHSQELTNIKVFNDDANLVLDQVIADHSLDRVQIFFPDPWPKKRHHKRRLIQPGLIKQIAKKLKPGGLLHLATDWENYAEHMLTVLEAEATLKNKAGSGNYHPRPMIRPVTKFERRGKDLGHKIFDLLFTTES